MPDRRIDPGTKNGIDKSLNSAFAPDSPIDPKLRKLIREADGVYIPDEVSDRRIGQLIERLEHLPWGQPRS